MNVTGSGTILHVPDVATLFFWTVARVFDITIIRLNRLKKHWKGLKTPLQLVIVGRSKDSCQQFQEYFEEKCGKNHIASIWGGAI
jgi:hypothetical protein